MVQWILIAFFVSIFLLAFSYRKVYGWMGSMNPGSGRQSYKDVHFSDTMQWCMQEGMGQVYAYQTAYSCNLVDVIHKFDRGWHLNTSPPGAVDSRDIYFMEEYSLVLQCVDAAYGYMRCADDHIVDEAQKQQLYQQAERYKWEAVTHLGYSLHPLEDKLAHMNASCGRNNTGLKHGEPGTVAVLKQDGSFYETRVQGDLFDNVDYDFEGNRESCPLEGQWYYLGEGGKYINSRWIDTEYSAREVIRRFLDYGESKNIYFQ